MHCTKKNFLSEEGIKRIEERRKLKYDSKIITDLILRLSSQGLLNQRQRFPLTYNRK